jgi:hypothetical protein
VKKVLIGVGIGCGVIVLLSVVALVAGGIWAKNKMGNVVELGQTMKVQTEELKALNAKFPFSAPPAGQPLKLEEERLKRYLTVRQLLIPVQTRFEEKAQELKTKSDKEEIGLGEGLAAAGAMAQLMTDLRAALIEGLRQQEMSPREFHATSRVVYPHSFNANAPAGPPELQTLNAKLLEQHKAQIEQGSNEALDSLLSGDVGLTDEMDESEPKQ